METQIVDVSMHLFKYILNNFNIAPLAMIEEFSNSGQQTGSSIILSKKKKTKKFIAPCNQASITQSAVNLKLFNETKKRNEHEDTERRKMCLARHDNKWP